MKILVSSSMIYLSLIHEVTYECNPRGEKRDSRTPLYFHRTPVVLRLYFEVLESRFSPLETYSLAIDHDY